MGHMILAGSELAALRDLLALVLRKGKSNGNYIEILACLLSVEYNAADWKNFQEFKQDFLQIGGEVAKTGWERATRVYTTLKDRPTKPSYLKRLVAYPDSPRKGAEGTSQLDQLSKISAEMAKKPGYSNLSFVFLRPADLHDQFRPGYVPCPIAGDFKFRNGTLDLNVMFRTSDAFAVGYADIYYLRRLQNETLERAKTLTTNTVLRDGRPGVLNLFFARTYVEKSKQLKVGPQIGERVRILPLVERLINAIDKRATAHENF